MNKDTFIFLVLPCILSIVVMATIVTIENGPDGTKITVTESKFLNITFESDRVVNANVISVRNMIILDISRVDDSLETQITLSGLKPNTKYYMYVGDYRNGAEMISDSYGEYSFTQDISEPVMIFIQTVKSTYFISDDASGGDCSSIGSWNSVTKTCTLNADIAQSVQIDSDGITLDCDNHVLSGSRTGFGIFITGKNNVVVKNCRSTSFSYGLGLFSSNNCIVENSDLSSNNAAGVWLSSTVATTLRSNSINSNYADGMWIYSASNNNLVEDNNIERNTASSVWISGSDSNTLRNNILGTLSLYEAYAALIIESGNNNVVEGNTIKNTVPYGTAGAYVMNGDGNIFTENTFENNVNGLLLEGCTDTEITQNIFTSNTQHASVNGGSNNDFDQLYPVGGNYWEGSGLTDGNSDGVAEAPYVFSGGQDNSPWVVLNGWKDEDGDGYIKVEDCDDADSTVNPGEIEMPNARDDNCNGQIDERICGNGILEIPEHCEDGNLADGDGCSSLCRSEIADSEFDDVEIVDNGDGTSDYTFTEDNVPHIEIENNNGAIDLSDFDFDYIDSGSQVRIVIDGLDPNGTRKAITIKYKINICVLDDETVYAGTPTGLPLCYFSANRIQWVNYLSNPCNKEFEVPGKDSDGNDVPGVTCQQVRIDGQSYSKIRGLSHTVVVANDNIDAALYNDLDDDGYFDNVDCNDNDANINPGKNEICDGIDNNCDGNIDEGGDALCQNDEIFCNGKNVCNGAGGCVLEMPDCSENDLSSVSSCNNQDDGNSMTLDSFAGFTSTCNAALDKCTTGTVTFSSVCDKETCGAECTSNGECGENSCQSKNGCYDGVYRLYSASQNSCLNCACVYGACTSFTERSTDRDNDGYNVECENDCNDRMAFINPGAMEMPGNRFDENCDGMILCNPAADWKNHGQYVNCVSKEIAKLLKDARINQKKAKDLLSDAEKTKIEIPKKDRLGIFFWWRN